MQFEIDDQAISLLALQQPMASDLRLIAIKINTDLERMGDLAVNIAECALSLTDESVVPMDESVVPHLIDILHIAENMVRMSLDAFVSKDAALAQSILSSDDAVDALRSAFFHKLISFMQREPNHIPQGVKSVVDRAEPGASSRPRHQDRRRRVVLRKRDRRAAPRRDCCEGLSTRPRTQRPGIGWI